MSESAWLRKCASEPALRSCLISLLLSPASPQTSAESRLCLALSAGGGEGGYRSAPGYGRREGAADRPGLLSSKGGGWFALPGTPGDVACLGKESFLCVMSEGDG